MSIKSLPSILSLAALAFGFQTPATAGVVISGDYYEQTTDYETCSGGVICRVNFEPIPEDKILDIQRVNCYAQVNQRILALYGGASPTLGGSTSRLMFYEFQAIEPGTGTNYYILDKETIYRMGASRYLFLTVSSSVGFSGTFKCGIIGKLTPK